MMTLKHSHKLLSVVVLCILLVGCQGAQFPSIDQMITNLGSSISGLWRLVTAASYILGMVFIFRGVYQLKLYGDLRTMMSTQTNFKATLMLFLVGAALIFYKPAYQTFLVTAFGSPNITPIGYGTSPLGMSSAMRVILQFVQLMGFISFIRGWIYLTQASNPGSHSSTGKAMTHIIGGVLAINIEGTANILKGTFGII